MKFIVTVQRSENPKGNWRFMNHFLLVPNFRTLSSEKNFFFRTYNQVMKMKIYFRAFHKGDIFY